MLVYHFELSLEDGFELLDKAKEDRLWRGKRVSSCSGWPLFSALRGGPVRCWECGVAADRWIADKGQKDLVGPPVLNLYASKADGRIVLMNRDHIIPRSLGGTDALENLRPACADCNGARGNKMTQAELDFKAANPHLFSKARFLRSLAKAEDHLLRNPSEVNETIILEPFKAIAADTARSANSIRSQISAAPAKKKRKKKNTKPVAVIQSPDRLVTDPQEQVALAYANVTLFWKNEDGKFVGPYVKEKT